MDASFTSVTILEQLTHWGRVTHICISRLTIIGSDNGLWPDWRQAIIWTSARILLIWSLGTNFSEILIEIHTFLFKKMHLKMSSGKWRPFCSGLNVLNMKWIVQFTPNNWIWFLCPHASVQRVIIGLSHYRNRCWLVVNQILRNKLQWFFLYQNSQISVVLPSVQWVNWFKTLLTVALASCGDTASKINDIGLTLHWRHNDTVVSQITNLTVVYSIVYSDRDQRKHQSSASLAIVRGIHRDRWIPRTKGH